MAKKDLLSSISDIDKASSKIKSFINGLVDAESFVETDALMTGKGFDSASDALGEGVVTGYATINGHPVHLFAQNAEVLKGSLGESHAKKIIKCMDRASKTRTPLLSIIDSCGARVGEGAAIMEGYASLIAASASLNVPNICILKGVATGMMTSYIASCDFAFMSKDAICSVNSPMHLVSNVKNFPVDYKKYLGFDAYKDNSDLVQFTYSTEKDLSKKIVTLFDNLNHSFDEEVNDDPNRIDPKLEKVSALEAVDLILDKKSIIEYAPDYAKDVKCALGRLNGISVGVVATSGDYMSLSGVKKINSFVEKLECFNLPLVTLVDTLGVNPSLENETSGVAKITYSLMRTISQSPISKIGIAFGNAVGYGYSALLSKGIGFDYTLATTNAKVSPVSEEVAIAMMCDQLKEKDRPENLKALSEKYAQMLTNPLEAAKEGYIDNVVEATNLRPYISSALLMLMGI